MTTATPWTLTDIEAAIPAGWSAEACSPDDVERAPWTADNPAWGHCDITSLVVKDLTREQFRRGQVVTEGRLMGPRPQGRLPRLWEEYRLLRGWVGAGLGAIGG